ncbi:MAG: Bax inhibitor-1/YccA family protein [Ilumatobacteraceae bacterium]|nr:Bax inhibitor-1/YccA family protein [Ilumatobacteraceae bacterium]
MSNPILNESRFQKLRKGTAGDAGWGVGSGQPANTWAPPINDGPGSPHHPGVMTVGGTASASMVLFALLLVSAAVGWIAVAEPQPGVLSFPPMAFVGAIIGFIAVMVTVFKPMTSHILGPVYAVGQGLFVGALSKMFDATYSGIVVQAVGTTLAVFGVMLFLYRTRILRVTDKFRRIVIGATLGVMVFYLASFVFSMFGANVSFLSSSSGMGILFSLFVAGLAAFNLALDFDFIERGEAMGLPRRMEWFAALGLLVTLVWLYLEVLRLLAKLRDR